LAAGRRFFAAPRFLAAGRRFFAAVRFFAGRFLAVERFFVAPARFLVLRFFALDVLRRLADVALRLVALRFVVFLPLAVVATVSRSFRSRLLRLRKLMPASFTSFSASRSWASFKSVLPPLLNSSRRSRRAFCEASSDALARLIALLPPPLRREGEVLLRAGARLEVRVRALLLRVAAIHTPPPFRLVCAA
jgi:hypothetical protein